VTTFCEYSARGQRSRRGDARHAAAGGEDLRLPGGGHDGPRASSEARHRHHRHHRPATLFGNSGAPAARSCWRTPGVADTTRGRHSCSAPAIAPARLDAALINGNRLACASTYDDVSGVLGGHHFRTRDGAHLSRFGEQLKVSGKRGRWPPYIIGVETEVRLSRRRQLPPLRQGLAPHPPRSATFGAAGVGPPISSASTSRAPPRRWRLPPRSRAASRPTSAQ